ncbi:MAG: hypothetical protein KY459_05365 [Acidobacteria bacterium]|nr:hypothetical protein [Acidobacteriota bacterium]
MIHGLIVTHGGLADELLEAAKRIEGTIEGIEALTLDWDEDVDRAQERVRAAVDRIIRRGTDLIIFTDMFGGTPSNLSMPFMQEGKVEVITGVNLPMIVKFGALNRGDCELSQISQIVREKGARAICVASELLHQQAAGGEEK